MRARRIAFALRIVFAAIFLVSAKCGECWGHGYSKARLVEFPAQFFIGQLPESNKLNRFAILEAAGAWADRPCRESIALSNSSWRVDLGGACIVRSRGERVFILKFDQATLNNSGHSSDIPKDEGDIPVVDIWRLGSRLYLDSLWEEPGTLKIKKSLLGYSRVSPKLYSLVDTYSEERNCCHYQGGSEPSQFVRIRGETTSIVVAFAPLLVWCIFAGITCIAFSAGFSAFAAGQLALGLLLFAEGTLFYIVGAILAAKWI